MPAPADVHDLVAEIRPKLQTPWLRQEVLLQRSLRQLPQNDPNLDGVAHLLLRVVFEARQVALEELQPALQVAVERPAQKL